MKIAIVTGASSGMGKEFVRQIERFYRELDEIWVIARSEKKLEEIKKSHKTYIRIFAGDMEEDLVYKQVKNRLENQNPDIRMLVNAAGFGKTGTVEEIAKEDKKLQLRMIDLNCRGLTEMTCTCLPWMHKGTRIINLASAAAFCPQAKFAVEIAAVGGIDIQVVPVFIRNGKAFFHVFHSSLYRRFPFSRVIRAISSGVTPFQAARVSST